MELFKDIKIDGVTLNVKAEVEYDGHDWSVSIDEVWHKGEPIYNLLSIDACIEIHTQIKSSL